MKDVELTIIEKFIRDTIDYDYDLEIEEAFNFNKNKKYHDPKRATMELFIPETKKIKQKNENIIMLYGYKDNKISNRVIYGFLFKYKDSYYDISTNLRYSFQNDNIENTEIFDILFIEGDNNFLKDELKRNKFNAIGKYNLNAKCISINFIKRKIGENIYNEIIHFFLKNENLLVKNAIYKTY